MKRIFKNRLIKFYLIRPNPAHFILLFFAAVLAFSISMPNQVMALELLNLENKQKVPSTLAATNVDTSQARKLAANESPVNSLSVTPTKKVDHSYDHEIVSKRTPFTSTYVNKDGSKTLTYSAIQQNYKKVDNTWGKIDNTLSAVANAAPTPNLFQVLTNTAPAADPPSEFKGSAGLLGTDIKPLSDGLTINAGSKTFTMKPAGAANIYPQQLDDHTVVYRNAWPNVDLQYQLRGEAVKEIIVVKDKSAQTNFDFNIVGGKVIPSTTDKGQLTVEGVPSDFSFSTLTLDVNGQGVISENRVNQAATDDGIRVSMDRAWMQSQPASSFPMRIDPSFARDSTSYWMFKSDGYSCGSSNCYANIGTINSGGWKYWRSYAQFPYSDMAGKHILSANMHGYYQGGIGGSTTANHWVVMGHAPCISFNCQGAQVGASVTGADFNIDFTAGLQSSINSGDYGAVWSFWGEEGGTTTYKPYYNLQAQIVYDTPTPQATPTNPTNQQVIVTTQPTLRVNPVSDGDGEAVKYYFRVSTSQDAEAGAVINSGWIYANQYTIPDGILQDGTTYYWHVYTWGDSATGQITSPVNVWVNSFKVNLRSGQDSTQAYDNLGPVGVDLATGNTTTSASTHSMSALGGNIGLSMDYNTPTKAKNGLVGNYWNVPSGYGGGVPTSAPNLTRIDQDINFNWPNGSSPDPSINNDWFYAQWLGNFVAPTSGTYYFGGNDDDSMTIIVNGQTLYNAGCYTGTCYNGSINLTAGQVVPLEVRFEEATGNAYATVYVKGAVPEQVMNRDWLRTNVMASQTQYGLNGRYYTDDGSHNYPTNPNSFMMARVDSKLSFNWQGAGPATGLQGTNFLTKWTGYVTVPTTGTYTFGAVSDDGVRIILNNGTGGSPNTVLNSWVPQNTTLTGTATTLTAGVAVPIEIDYFQAAGGAQFDLLVSGPGLSSQQEIPVTWLTPKANALPGGWQLGVDVDGHVNYERLRVAGSNVILEDSTGDTHEYTWTGGGFKPPVNEDGQLVRNADNTYTFSDTDGRTYIFDAEGKLLSLTSATDDRHPASLTYTYSGDPARLTTITDGVTSSRSGSLYYKSVNDNSTLCPIPTGFDPAPDGMLCAFQTTDGNITRLYYKAGQLSRIEKPGSEETDYGYDSFGRITSVRGSLAYDAITAGVRTDDANLLTQLNYDSLGRVSSVISPAPSVGANRVTASYDYQAGSTLKHLSGANEPNGFSEKVDYDSLFRATKETDANNQAKLTEWDPQKDLVKSQTDPTGMKSTKIYDTEDRLVASYGPAPAAWYDATGVPLSTYASQVPKTTTAYDEGLTGLAVAYSNSDATVLRTSMNGGDTITPGTTLTSPDHRFQFAYQTDGNLVVWQVGNPTALWTSGTGGMASTRLFLQYDGNLVLFNGGTGIWSTGGTTGSGNAYLNMQNDGNFVITRPNNSYWQTQTGGHSPATTSSVSLTGAPLLHATNIATDGTMTRDFTANPALTNQTTGWGMTLTGKMRLPTQGTWNFRLFTDNGARVWIDDQLVLDDWTYYNGGRNHPTFTYSNSGDSGPNVAHRIRIDYFHAPAGCACFSLNMTPPSGTETANVAQYFNPDYSLDTSETDYDAQLGNMQTKTVYGSPEYGLATAKVVDPNGLNLQTTSTYETPGTGYLRQTAKTMPGGTTTTYQYYGANDTADNPCTTAVEAYHEAGMLEGKTEADPDGSGPQTGRTTQEVYDDSGNVVASRFNSDPWTCFTYDSRGRETESLQPAVNGRPGRTVDTSYAYNGNPFVKQVSDSVAGASTETRDLLGRLVGSTDVWGNAYTTTYDDYGNVTQKTGPLGTETTAYDSLYRPTSYTLDGTTLATITYDSYGRIATVTYPQAKDSSNNMLTMTQTKHDSLSRVNGDTFQTSDGKTYDESVVLSQLGKVISATQTYNGQTLNGSYSYDAGGRITSATVGETKFDYGYNAPDAATCSSNSADNSLSNKNSNRTSFQITNVTTSTVVEQDKLCYDYADKLTQSTDNSIGTPTYDDHGNTTSFSGNGTALSFGYDANDYNTSVQQGNKRTEYVRTSTGDVLRRKDYVSGALVSSLRYVADGDVLQTCSLSDDNSCATTDRYISLPGNVTLTLSPSNSDPNKQTVYSLHNFHGDTVLTLTGQGKTASVTSTLLGYGPFGEQLIAGTAGTTTQDPLNASDKTMGWAANPSRKLDTSYTTNFVQMGARTYIPTLGRFLQVDPVEGGTPSAYTYVTDPINENDYSGKCGPLMLVCIVLIVVLVAVSIQSAKNSLQQHPSSPVAWINAGLSVAGAGSVMSSVSSSAASSAARSAASSTSKVAASAPKTAARSAAKSNVSSVLPNVPIPDSVKAVWSKIVANNYSSIGPGYSVKPYANDGRSGSELLPQKDGVTYTEFYLNPSPNQGAERIVRGSDGSLYYTADHYQNFTPMN